MMEKIDPETSTAVRARVCVARERQLARQGKPNAWLQARETVRYCATDAAAENLLKQAIGRLLALSAQGYHRVLRVARSIADLAQEESVGAMQIAEAIQYRRIDPTF